MNLKKFKIQPSTGKEILTIFLELYYYLENRSIATLVGYREMKAKKLKSVICIKCTGLLKKILLLHNNASHGTAAHTIKTFEKFSFALLDHHV